MGTAQWQTPTPGLWTTSVSGGPADDDFGRCGIDALVVAVVRSAQADEQHRLRGW